MSKPILSVRFFRTKAGHEPVRDLLRELTLEDRKAVGTDIKTVQFGWPLGMPLVRKLEQDLWEVRSHIEGRIARVIFTIVADQMVLLHAFFKKSQKTPRIEVEKAKARKRLL
jgi:phage-related protein